MSGALQPEPSPNRALGDLQVGVVDEVFDRHVVGFSVTRSKADRGEKEIISRGGEQFGAANRKVPKWKLDGQWQAGRELR